MSYKVVRLVCTLLCSMHYTLHSVAHVSFLYVVQLRLINKPPGHEQSWALSRIPQNARCIVILSPDTCLAAIVKPEGGPANGKVYTPEEWNTETTLETGAYRYSKV